MKIALINPGPQRIPDKLGIGSGDPEIIRLSEINALALKEERLRRIEKFSLDLEKEPKYREYIISTGLLSIASYVREKENAKVNYIQYDYFEKQGRKSKILEDLKDFDVIGITANTDNYYKATKILRTIKRKNPNILTVIGGPHVTYQDIQAVNDADVVVRGEGEETFRQVINAGNPRDLEEIKGITYKDNGRIKRNPPQKLLNINDLPTPAFDLIPNDIRDNCLVYLSTSRGCPYRCAYCVETNFWRGIRYRNPDKVVKDIEEYLKFVKTKELFFSDSTFNCNQRRLSTLLKYLEHFDLYYYANFRPELFTNDIINLLKKCRFIGLFIGLQSASNDVLTRVHRLPTLGNFEVFLKKIEKSVGIFPFSSLSFIFGLPSETIKTANETISTFSWFYDVGVFSITTTVLVPYPGTPIFEFPEKYGVKILTKDYSKYCRYDLPVFDLDTLDHNQIWKLYLKAFKTITKLNCSRVGLNLFS